jgi:hypothetical protein
MGVGLGDASIEEGTIFRLLPGIFGIVPLHAVILNGLADWEFCGAAGLRSEKSRFPTPQNTRR